MKKLFILSIGLCSLAMAQKKADPKKYASIITPQSLREHLTIVASAEMEGRETATQGEYRAAAYLQTQFINLGLKPGGTNGYKMPYNVYRDSVAKTFININGKAYKWNTDFGVYTDVNHGEELRFGDAVFAGYGVSNSKYDDYKNLNVSGKLVVVLEGEPKKDTTYLASGTGRPSQFSAPRAKITQATKAGAAALLIITKKFPMAQYNNTLSAMKVNLHTVDQPVNTYFISEDMARQIFKEKYDSIKMHEANTDIALKNNIAAAKVEIEYDRELQTLTSNNILGVIEGTDKKDEYLFITAHYDHIGKRGNIINFGADDDGSGTVSVLKLAHAFAKAKAEGKGPRRTIVFMLVSGEEKGLWGSRYYSDNPIYDLSKTTADLNIDMIGRIGTDYTKQPDSLNYLYVIGNDKLSTDLENISENLNKKNKLNLKLDYKFNDINNPDRIYYRSDHYNFARKGVPILFYFDGVHADYHRPGDTADKINYDLMAKRAQLVFYTAWQMANADNMLVRDKTLP
jgi:hypothetical protein